MAIFEAQSPFPGNDLRIVTSEEVEEEEDDQEAIDTILREERERAEAQIAKLKDQARRKKAPAAAAPAVQNQEAAPANSFVQREIHRARLADAIRKDEELRARRVVERKKKNAENLQAFLALPPAPTTLAEGRRDVPRANPYKSFMTLTSPVRMLSARPPNPFMPARPAP